MTPGCTRGSAALGTHRREAPLLRWVYLLILLVGFFGAMQASADEIRPALLDIKEQNTGLFAVTWKVPTRNGQALALLMFNVGVETGQLLFIGVVLSLIAILKRLPISPPQGAWRVVPYSIGGLAAF